MNMLSTLNHGNQFMYLFIYFLFFCLSLKRIQAVSPGNQKEVAGHHEAPEKSKKRWEVDMEHRVLVNSVVIVDWLNDGLVWTGALSRIVSEITAQSNQNGWCSLEAPFQLWIFACLSRINQRCCFRSWLCFHWPWLLPLFNFLFLCRIYCSITFRG